MLLLDLNIPITDDINPMKRSSFETPALCISHGFLLLLLPPFTPSVLLRIQSDKHRFLSHKTF